MIYIGCDHGGFDLKMAIKAYFDERKVNYRDFGTNSTESVDYPYFAELVANAVVNDENSKGILICGTGIGISIAANKIKGVRAALCSNVYYAEMARKHNDANILCLGGRVLNSGEAISIIEMFLLTKFEGGRHQKRILQISELEQK